MQFVSRLGDFQKTETKVRRQEDNLKDELL